MRVPAVVGLALTLATSALAQQGGIVTEPLPPLVLDAPKDTLLNEPRDSALSQVVASAPGAVLRGLDKVSGDVTDLTLGVGEAIRIGRIVVELGDCRYPVDNPSGDAYAMLTVRADGLSEPAFEGWMIASSPALSALDHPRYDVWVIRCTTS